MNHALFGAPFIPPRRHSSRRYTAWLMDMNDGGRRRLEEEAAKGAVKEAAKEEAGAAEAEVINKIIHQIWYQGAAAVPAAMAENARKLRELNPDWEYRLWDAEGLRAACAAVGGSTLLRWEGFEHMHQRIDFGRYVVLLLHGGLSVDMDVVALRPLTPGLQAAGLMEAPVPVFSRTASMGGLETFFFTRGRRTRRIVNNAMILSPRPGDRGMVELVRALEVPTSTETRMRRQHSRADARDMIMVTTGPERVSEVVDELEAQGLVRVVPPLLFEPCNGLDPVCVPPEGSLLDHRHTRTWLPEHTWDQTVAPLYLRARAGWPQGLPATPVLGAVAVAVLALAATIVRSCIRTRMSMR